jgi:intein-encoded DNA endonuclease-like protein
LNVVGADVYNMYDNNAFTNASNWVFEKYRESREDFKWTNKSTLVEIAEKLLIHTKMA